ADLDASLRALISGMAALTGANRGGVRLLDNPDDLTGNARLYFWNGGDSYTWLHLPATYGPNTIDVLRTGVPTYTPDIRLLDGEGEIVQRIVLQERILSSLIVPLRVVGRVVGTVHADATQAHCFRDAQLKPLQLLADQAGGAVEQARLRALHKAGIECCKNLLTTRTKTSIILGGFGTSERGNSGFRTAYICK
ncbi:MAG: hypothetical protein B7Z71_05975, partial [Acidocella sp. 21-58-7]